MPKYITIPVTGKLYWVEVWFRDNSTNPDGVQVIESETKTVRTVRISTFNESNKSTVENTKQSVGASAEVGGSYGVVSATVKTEVSASKEITDTYSYTAKEQRDISVEETIIDRTKYEIRGGGKLGLYQAYFSAPGIEVSLHQTTTGGSRPETQQIDLDVRMQQLQFLSTIEVIYTDNYNDRPFDGLHEITGQNEDINSGFNGKFVYLKPNYTTKVNNALTDCRIRIQDSKWSGGSDLAAGAGGEYRYLQFNKDTNNFNKYESAALLRRAGNPASIKDAPGFNVLTTDINKNRGGDYLYVAFLQREVFEVEKIKT